MTWKKITLGECVFELRGGASIKGDEFTESGFPVLHKGTIREGAHLVFDRDEKSHVPTDYASSKPNSVVDCDFVVATFRNLIRTGETLGFMAPVPDGTQYLLAQGAYGLKLDESRLHKRFLSHLSNAWIFHKEVLRRMVGTTQVHIRNGEFLKIPIPLPPLAEQKRIASILDAADALRARRREALEQLDTLLQSTFMDMFGDPVTNPMGWEVEPLNKLSDILTGFAFPSGEYLPKNTGQALCRGINIGIGKIDWKDRADWTDEPDPKIEKFRLEANDIVLAMDRPWISSGLKIAIISESDLPSMLVQRVSRIRCFDHATRPLIYALINSPIFERHCNPTETTVPHISPKDIKSFPIIQPPLDLQKRFARFVESVEQQKAAHRKHLEELDTLFAALQQRAFSGELTAADAPAEPAGAETATSKTASPKKSKPRKSKRSKKNAPETQEPVA